MFTINDTIMNYGRGKKKKNKKKITFLSVFADLSLAT